jgi:N-carbamoyl-D-amino-acid hydrolase
MIISIAAAQLGPIARTHTRADVVPRLVALLEQARARAIDHVVFPEMALTTFFPRWDIPPGPELDSYFEPSMPSPATQPLFDAARRLGVGFYLGYCERAEDGTPYNASVLVGRDGAILGRYRKIHVPGTAEPVPGLPYQHLEKRYFRDGDLGFGVWDAWGGRVGMAICNDRRWPETYRVMALQRADLVVLGYNSPAQMPDWPEQNEHRAMHHMLPMQAAAYQNGLWIVAAAKAGREEGVDMLAHSCVIAPTGAVVAQSYGFGDELVAATIDLSLADYFKSFHGLFTNRRPRHYRPIADP